MNRCRFEKLYIAASARPRCLLYIIWIFGLTVGGLYALSAGPSYSSLMPALSHSRLSIVGLLYIPLLPFLFSAIAVYLSYSRLIYLICGCKAFCFGAAVCMVRSVFGSAGWLVQSLLLFTDCLTLPGLFWLWLGALCRSPRQQLLRRSAVCMGWFGLIAAADWNLTAPLLEQIL